MIKEFDARYEPDDAFDADMEWEERKASLEQDVKEAERHKYLLSEELSEARISVWAAIAELNAHLASKPN